MPDLQIDSAYIVVCFMQKVKTNTRPVRPNLNTRPVGLSINVVLNPNTSSPQDATHQPSQIHGYCW